MRLLWLLLLTGCACREIPLVQFSAQTYSCTAGRYVLLPWLGNCHQVPGCAEDVVEGEQP